MLAVMVMQKNQGKRSKVKVTEVKSNFAPIFRTVTPPRIGRLLRKDTFFFKINRQSSRSHGTKKSPIFTRFERFRTVTTLLIPQWLWNDAQRLK